MFGIVEKEEIYNYVKNAYPLINLKDIIFNIPMIVMLLILTIFSTIANWQTTMIPSFIFGGSFVLYSLFFGLKVLLKRNRQNKVNLMVIYGDPLHPTFLLYDIPDDIQLKRNLINFRLIHVINELKKITDINSMDISPYLFIRFKSGSFVSLGLLKKIGKKLKIYRSNDIDINWKPFDQTDMINILKKEIISLLVKEKAYDLTQNQRSEISKI